MYIDLPILVRFAYKNNVSAVNLNKPFDGHVDIPRLKEGKVGGFFWSVYVDCPTKEEESDDFLKPTNRVRYVLSVVHLCKCMRVLTDYI